MSANESSVSFCQSCQAPIGGTSGLDPIKTIHAEAFVLQKAITKRPKPIVLLGVWVLFLPWLVGAGSIAVNEMLNGYGMPSLVFFWLGIALSLVAVKFLYVVTRNYFTMTD